ncbi:MAG: UDP-galactopyranose mutase [Lachnospiraceae bacterium]|nr:UDP-galactopyranose mutase [Lachnospiraceae bacterium]
MKYPFVIVGAGLAGLTIAERIANVLNQKVLIIEKRPHIAGNVYDFYNDDGILIQKYGPHTFHTNNKKVYDYLSQFTKWRDYQHRVMSYVNGHYVPFPISIETINQLYNKNLTSEEMFEFIENRKVSIDDVRTSEDVVLSNAGIELYEIFFKNFTIKQWGVSPAELDKTVISRIPFRNNRDTRYFTDIYQGQPLYGYTRMAEAMCDHPNINIMLKTDYKDIINHIEYDNLIYTGPIDYFFDFCYGELRYRSVRMQFETHDLESYQPAPSTRYPNDYDYTRITEFKKLTGQVHSKTTILKEFPCDEGEPYYPFPTEEWKVVAGKYRKKAENEEKSFFLGRLAEYRYYDMDDVVEAALNLFSFLYSIK